MAYLPEETLVQVAGVDGMLQLLETGKGPELEGVLSHTDAVEDLVKLLGSRPGVAPAPIVRGDGGHALSRAAVAAGQEDPDPRQRVRSPDR